MLNVLVYAFFAGVLGLLIGGVIALFLRDKGSNLTGIAVGLSGGIMLAVTCLELIPEAIRQGGVLLGLCSTYLGAVLVLVIERGADTARASGIALAIAIAVHNAPEGLAIGASAITGYEMLFSLVIGLHNVPEGIAVATPMIRSGMRRRTVLFTVALVGSVTVLGAFLGHVIGTLSREATALSMGLAAGAMLYVVWEDLMPEFHTAYRGKHESMIIVCGVLIGVLLTVVVG